MKFEVGRVGATMGGSLDGWFLCLCRQVVETGAVVVGGSFVPDSEEDLELDAIPQSIQ